MQRFRYLVVFEKAAHNYAAYSPDLPGCVATGATLAETRESMREAMAFHLEAMLRDGDEIPPSDPNDTAEYLEVDVANPASVTGHADDRPSAT